MKITIDDFFLINCYYFLKIHYIDYNLYILILENIFHPKKWQHMYNFSPNLCQKQQKIIPNHLCWHKFLLSTCINNDRYLTIWKLAKVNLNYTYLFITFLILLNCGHSFWNLNHNVPPCTPLFIKRFFISQFKQICLPFLEKKNKKTLGPFLNPFM